MDQEQVEARVARAHELHRAGYNCAQAVACSCADCTEDGVRMALGALAKAGILQAEVN